MAYGPFDRAMRYPVWIGVVLLCVGATLHYLGVRAVRNLGVEDARLFEPTPVVLDLRPDPATPELFGAQLFVGAFRAVYAVASTIGLLLFVVGLCSVFVGVVFVRRRFLTRVARGASSVATDPRRATAVGGLLGVGTVLYLSPLVRSVVVNAVSFLVASTAVFVLSVASLLRIERSAGPVTTVLVVGPLALASVFLSAVVGAFASPASGAFMLRVTRAVVRFLLLEVLAPVGLARPLVRVFELEGIGFLAFWVGVDVVAGVGIGLAGLRYRALSVRGAARWVRVTVAGWNDGERPP